MCHIGILVPFPGTRDDHTWVSCVTNWKHDSGDAVEQESSGALELTRQALCSFFPLKKEHLSALKAHGTAATAATVTVAGGRGPPPFPHDQRGDWSQTARGYGIISTLGDLGLPFDWIH